MELSGIASYLISFLTFAGVYAVLALGLNMQWGFTGQFNIGIAGFFAVGAYTSAILTTPSSPAYLGGFGMPFLVGLAGAVIASTLLGLVVGLITARLRTDYLAIASIGIAEMVRLFVKNEDWLTNGVRGIAGIERPFADTVLDSPLTYLVIVALFVAGVYFLVERAYASPWGRVLRAIRENEPATAAAGKSIAGFRLQAFVLGSAIMGLGGGLYAHFFGFLSPEAFMPLYGTFLVWVMLIAGGSGNNRGAILGAVLVWGVWSGTELLTGLLPAEHATQGAALRVLLIGVLLQVILVTRPEGVLPEKPPRLIARKR
ncbi:MULTISPECIES: branched-chain amino acid ABC transporter permease [Chromohalobacter]|uniref:Amino acid/amide ABC transporter membrane protein 2, HAAT family n=1 Tax=Chromohalobacter israelensis (strain ATCC BAA-138 / DSM 3043 / CIP 106854 / NCIMB 13768 / 1H11) TaxID=290398 RepID=Q1QXN5_CHRI1|nr:MULTISPECIES: branched-chain amino acid ABC transporter permease [Chromohalobacter]ABE58773.1 amino acid/amide ABC transporter membrane protein 2, HAAT family [Chromohalobacter salexigens DSM 3043]NQY44634.1 branched-chain amino acid ABC transporter permease [Chromohalobacter sp.]